MSFLKSTMKRAVYRLGYTISGDPSLVDFLRSRNVDMVLDVGANVGQFSRSIRQFGYQGKIVSYEPVSSTFQQLQTNMRGDSGWTGKQAALGETTGTAVIHVTEDPVFSSVASQTDEARLFGHSAHVDRTEQIEVLALDDVFHEVRGTNTFLKVDTQGFEQAVLSGAAGALPHICGLQLELPIRQLYEGTWSLPEALQKLEDYGFTVAQMRPSSFPPDDPSCWTEIDCVFRRK